MRYIVCFVGLFLLVSPSIAWAQYPGRVPARAPRTAVVPRTAKPTPTNRASAAPHPTASPEKVEAAINQRIASLQKMLARESKLLEVRLGDLEKKRQGAIEKGDNKTLRSIEQLESKIVKDYEAKVSRLVASMSAAPQATPVGDTIPRSSPSAKSGRKPAPQKRAPAPKKTFRLWPF
jgi:hypothetical protein